MPSWFRSASRRLRQGPQKFNKEADAAIMSTVQPLFTTEGKQVPYGKDLAKRRVKAQMDSHKGGY